MFRAVNLILIPLYQLLVSRLPYVIGVSESLVAALLLQITPGPLDLGRVFGGYPFHSFGHVSSQGEFKMTRYITRDVTRDVMRDNFPHNRV